MGGFANIDAGVVDEDVDPPQLAQRARDHGRDGGLVGDIRRHCYRLDTVLRELGGSSKRLRFIASDNRDIGAGLRQSPRHAEADAAIAAGDDGNLAGKIEWF